MNFKPGDSLIGHPAAVCSVQWWGDLRCPAHRGKTELPAGLHAACSRADVSTEQSAVQCSAVQCSAVQCSAVQCSAVQCSAVQCSAVQCSAVKCSAVQCSARQASRQLIPIYDCLAGASAQYRVLPAPGTAKPVPGTWLPQKYTQHMHRMENNVALTEKFR